MLWMATDVELFAKWIQAELDRRDMTQADLARKSGMPKATISNVVSSQRRAGSSFCRRLAKALDIPPDIVYQAAGLLPPEKKLSKLEKQIQYIVHEYKYDATREQALAYLQFLLKQEELNAKHHGSPSPAKQD